MPGTSAKHSSVTPASVGPARDSNATARTLVVAARSVERMDNNVPHPCGECLGEGVVSAVPHWRRMSDSSRALGSVKVRAGGESPRPGCSQQPVDQVELLDRRSKSGWEEARGTVLLSTP